MRRACVPLCGAILAGIAFVALAGDGNPPPPPAPASPPAAPPAPATPPALKAWSSADGRFTVSFPATWRLERSAIGEAVMSWETLVPAGGGVVLLDVFHVPGMVNARAQPYVERDLQTKRFRVMEPARPEREPLPHLWLDTRDGAVSLRVVWIYRVVRRNGFTLRVSCAPSAWPRIRDDCMRAAASIATTLEEWPPIPKGYRAVLRDGFAYRVHPAATDADVDAVHKRLRDLEAAFERQHGPLWHPPESPLLVYVHTKPEDVAVVDARAAATGHGVLASGEKQALFAAPPAKGDTAAAGEFAGQAWTAFLRQTFSGGMPFWMLLAERRAAEAEAMTGKPLPSVPDGFVAAGRTVTRRLDELAALESAGSDDVDEMFAYFAFLRCGPKPWRDAFASFLKDVASTGDCTTAERERILTLDQEKLRAAVQAWLPKGLTVVRLK